MQPQQLSSRCMTKILKGVQHHFKVEFLVLNQKLLSGGNGVTSRNYYYI